MKLYNLKKIFLLALCLVIIAYGFWQKIILVKASEQSGSSPTSATDSYMKTAYDWLVAKGSNYGSNDASDWSNDWGVYWNRIMEAAAWEPGGTATAGDVPSGITFYSNENDRTILTGTLFENQVNTAYDDWICSNNNEESSSACAGGDDEYTGEESNWTLTANGGAARSVTDNGSTVTLESNKVYLDNRTKLYWSDSVSITIDNEFSFVNGDNRSNPSGASCNLAGSGAANSYCDNQDPLNELSQDNDVSAAEFCLDLELDADNADSDDDGATGVETDWRLPTQKEYLQAYINGAANNIPNPLRNSWASTEPYSSRSRAHYSNIGSGNSLNDLKDSNGSRYARCVRRD